jgi:hypothetical protein
MTFEQRRNRLTTHFSERMPVVKRRISVQFCTTYNSDLRRHICPIPLVTSCPLTVRTALGCLTQPPTGDTRRHVVTAIQIYAAHKTPAHALSYITNSYTFQQITFTRILTVQQTAIANKCNYTWDIHYNILECYLHTMAL